MEVETEVLGIELQASNALHNRVMLQYVPLSLWMMEQISLGKKANDDGAVCVGLSIPQGGGKSTLTNFFEKSMYDALQVNTAVVSYDDFYLTHDELSRVREAHPGNKYLAGRGVAGTHDLELGARTLRGLVYETSDSSVIKVPVYDKSKHGGQGDRAPEAEWKETRGKVDLVIFEGWMLGHKSLPADDPKLDAFGPEFAEVNRLLRQYDSAWHSFIDAAICIGIRDPSLVYQWREQAEEDQRRSKGLEAMSSEEIKRFCDRFLPAYKLYLDSLMEHGLLADKSREVEYYLDKNRVPYLVD